MNVLKLTKSCRSLLSVFGVALLAAGLLQAAPKASAQEGDRPTIKNGAESFKVNFQQPQLPRSPQKGGGHLPGGGFPPGSTGPTFPPVFPDPEEPFPLGEPEPPQ